MRTLLKNALVVNVFTDEIIDQNVLIQDERIIGVGDYDEADADTVRDVRGRYVCPGFIDGHIHAESAQVLPARLAAACLRHGTTSIITDPHEIANVCGVDGIEFMLQASEDLPVTNYIMLPSCVPSSPHDESGAVISAEDLRPFYAHPRVLGLAEVMNYHGAIAGDGDLMRKIADAREAGRISNGHAPLLSGRDLDAYISRGIYDDHECASHAEGLERIRKGQTLMIRQGTTARDLDALLGFFDDPYSYRSILVSDDRNALTLDLHGDIDHIIRHAVHRGKSAVAGIRMATINPARHFGLMGLGAVAPGYIADILVLEDLTNLTVADVFKAGRLVVDKGEVLPFDVPAVDGRLVEKARRSFHIDPVSAGDFAIAEKGLCRVIGAVPGQLVTESLELEVEQADPGRDIAKIAVLERHRGTGQIGLGYVTGMGLREGAIASSVSHDSHNLIVSGMDDESMAVAANRIAQMGGGQCVVKDGRVLAELALPVAGLMSDGSIEETAEAHRRLLDSVALLGVPADRAPFMALSFISLPVIPFLKITARGLVDVVSQKRLGIKVD